MNNYKRGVAGLFAAALAAVGAALVLASTRISPSLDEQSDVPPDACKLRITAPTGARILIDGRDYGGHRLFTYRPLTPGVRYASHLDVRLEDLREERTIEIAGGRVIRVSLLADAAGDESNQDQAPADPVADLALRMNAFGMNLYSRLADRPGNIVLSPYGLESLLAVVASGAGGETRAQMAGVLRLRNERPEAFAALVESLEQAAGAASEGEPPASEWMSANAIWIQQDFDVRDEFIARAQQAYHAAVAPLDFAHDSAAARGAINDWVAAHTAGKIPQIAPPGSPPADARLFLANVVYFRGQWASQFAAGATEAAPFHLASGEAASVPMMKLTARLRWTRNERCQILELPYADRRIAMLVLLPEKTADAPSIEQSLCAAELTSWIDQLAIREAHVALPRFEVDYSQSLADALSALGMPEAFSMGADFSGISQQEGLMISSLVHRAWIGVDEQGAEAAAATGITMTPKSMVLEEKVNFTVDRPFVFCIRDQATGAILFVGRVSDPRPVEMEPGEMEIAP